MVVHPAGLRAVYLPEKTLELAELALKGSDFNEATHENAIRIVSATDISDTLAAALRPMLLGHPRFADRTLDLLWWMSFADNPGTWYSSFVEAEKTRSLRRK